MSSELRPAVFLDRDGTLIEEVGYCSRVEDVRAYEGARESLAALRDAGYLLVVITNQSGIGLGYFAEDEYRAVNAEFERQLAPVRIDAVYFSADTPDAQSERRKPGTGMVREAAAELGIDLARSFFIGDRAGDIECGRNSGMRTILVETGYGLKQADCGPDYQARDINEAARIILGGGRPDPSHSPATPESSSW
jgi:D-glycero-D-manno-heptose 1,7-bisphosphate phosphatase